MRYNKVLEIVDYSVIRQLSAKIQGLTGKILAWLDTDRAFVTWSLCANTERFDFVTGPQYQLA